MLFLAPPLAMPRTRAENYSLEFRAYRRKFLRPLLTAHGRWSWREGVIVRLTDANGRIGYGESAPTPGFTRETVEQDYAWLQKMAGRLSNPAIEKTPATLPCLRWALSCARAMMENRLPAPKKISPLPVAALLPAGRAALDALPKYLENGYHVFKWKVGVKSPLVEAALLEKLIARLPAHALLRLDANGALNLREWKFWCGALKSLGPATRAIEFFEQPGMFRLDNLRWAATAPVPVALDESVTASSARHHSSLKKWPGPLVIKPSLWSGLDDFIRWRVRTDLVYSSVFETSVGLHILLNLAATDARAGNRALGLGTLDAFADDGLQLPTHAPGPMLAPAKLSSADFLPLWNQLEKKI
jgi:O-succinylbenzoate synthase